MQRYVQKRLCKGEISWATAAEYQQDGRWHGVKDTKVVSFRSGLGGLGLQCFGRSWFQTAWVGLRPRFRRSYHKRYNIFRDGQSSRACPFSVLLAFYPDRSDRGRCRGHMRPCTSLDLLPNQRVFHILRCRLSQCNLGLFGGLPRDIDVGWSGGYMNSVQLIAD